MACPTRCFTFRVAGESGRHSGREGRKTISAMQSRLGLPRSGTCLVRRTNRRHYTTHPTRVNPDCGLTGRGRLRRCVTRAAPGTRGGGSSFRIIVDRNPLSSKNLCDAWLSSLSCLHLPGPPRRRPQRKIGVGGRSRITDVACLRKRASGNYALSFKGKGKSCLKALGPDDEQAA
jgi:hypothetical protein